MSDDSLSRVLTAATQKRLIFGGNPDTSFSLIVHSDLSPKDAPKVRRLQEYFREKYGVEMPVVGGGSGCTRLTFDCKTAVDLKTALRAIATDPDARALVKDLGATFRVSTQTSVFSLDGKDEDAMLAASEAMAPVRKLPPKKLHLSDLVSKSRKLPPRESLLELVVELREELTKVELLDFGDFKRVKEDVNFIHRAWQGDDVDVPGLNERLQRFEAFVSTCGKNNYPTAVGLVNMLCDILRTIQRAASSPSYV